MSAPETTACILLVVRWLVENCSKTEGQNDQRQRSDWLMRLSVLLQALMRPPPLQICRAVPQVRLVPRLPQPGYVPPHPVPLQLPVEQELTQPVCGYSWEMVAVQPLPRMQKSEQS